MDIVSVSVLTVFAGGFLLLCVAVQGLLELIGWMLRRMDK